MTGNNLQNLLDVDLERDSDASVYVKAEGVIIGETSGSVPIRNQSESSMILLPPRVAKGCILLTTLERMR